MNNIIRRAISWAYVQWIIPPVIQFNKMDLQRQHLRSNLYYSPDSWVFNSLYCPKWLIPFVLKEINQRSGKGTEKDNES